MSELGNLAMVEKISNNNEAAVKAVGSKPTFEVDEKFHNPETISERFAYNLAYVAKVVEQSHPTLNLEQRFELASRLENFADYELNGNGFKLVGPKASQLFELSLGKFGTEGTKEKVSGYIDTRMAGNNEVKKIKHDSVEALKDGKVREEFYTLVKKSISNAVDTFAKDNPKLVAAAAEEKEKPVEASQAGISTASNSIEKN